jgi:hypothetical protein
VAIFFIFVLEMQHMPMQIDAGALDYLADLAAKVANPAVVIYERSYGE